MTFKKSVCFYAAALLISLSGVANAQDGQLDTSFAHGGNVSNCIGSTNGIGWSSEANSVTVQSDGKIVAVGFSWIDAKIRHVFALVRYNADGSLDSTFGINGTDTTAIGPSDDRAYSVAIQSDGKIVAAGYSAIGAAGSPRVFALVRYNTDGSLDNTFGTNGIVKTAIGQSDDEAYSVAIQGDGKIVVAGTSHQVVSGEGVFLFALARYGSNGSLDNTFGASGIVTTALQISGNLQQDNKARSVLVQSDGRIVIGGYSGSNSLNYFAVLRYNSDGSLDNSFDTTGIALTAVGSANDGISSIAIQSDHKIVAGGYTQNSNEYDFALARYNADGSLDNSFGNNGVVTTSIWHLDDEISSIAIQSDGKIVAAGYSEQSQSSGDLFALARYNNDGSLDNTFGSNGIVTTSIAWGYDKAFSVAIQNDGKIIAAGFAFYNNFYDDNGFAIARYTGSSGPVNAVSVTAGLPKSFALYQNYPNPFNPSTMISYQLPMDSRVTLKVYDILGREVAALVNERQNPGSYSVTFDASKLPSGVYFYRLIAVGNNGERLVSVKKLVLMK